MRRFMWSLAALCALSGVATAAPITFNFESTAVGNYAALSLTQGGLTANITRNGGSFTIQNISGGGPASFGTRTLQNFTFGHVPGDFYNVNFSQAVQNVSLSFGDFGPSDDDSPVIMRAYSGLNGTGSLLATDTLTWGANDTFPNFKTLFNGVSGVQSVRFFGSGVFPNSLFWDNLVAEPAAVPEPFSLAVFGGLLAAGGLAVRRRMKATA